MKLLRRRRVGQLEAPEAGEAFARWRRRVRAHTLRLVWGEKAWLLLDWFQGFALLWALSQPWPWQVVQLAHSMQGRRMFQWSEY